VRTYDFLASGPKFANFFAQCGKACSWSPVFHIFDISIPSRDYADKVWSCSYSEIARTVNH